MLMTAWNDSVLAANPYHITGQCERCVLFDLPQWRFDLPRAFIDHNWKTYTAHWTPNSSTQMQSFDHIETHSLRPGYAA
jgi:hypothetical protein